MSSAAYDTPSLVAQAISGLGRKRPAVQGQAYQQSSAFNPQPFAGAVAAQQAPAASPNQAALAALATPAKTFDPAMYSAANVAAQLHTPGTVTTAPDQGPGQTVADWYKQRAAAEDLPTFPTQAGPYDLSQDPVLQTIQSQAALALRDQQAADWASRARLLVGFGDPKLASSILGGDYPDLKSINGKPAGGFSTLSQIAKGYNDQVDSAENDLNASNLFYSGARGKALDELAYGDQKAIAQATADVQSQLAQIDAAEAAARQGYTTQMMSAFSDAYARALAAALNKAPPPAATTPPPAAAAPPPIIGPQQPGTNPYDPWRHLPGEDRPDSGAPPQNATPVNGVYTPAPPAKKPTPIPHTPWRFW